MTDITKQQKLLNFADLASPPIIVMIYMLIIYNINGIYPFGDLSVSWCDMTQHVVPLLSELKDILSGKSSLFLNFHHASGMNLYAIAAFFLNSPFSLLAIFVPKEKMILFVSILVVLKMMTCAFTAGLCFYYISKKTNMLFRILLSVMYPFCGYTLLYYQNIIWLDMMYLFPLLVIALYRLVKEQKPIMYLIMVVVSIFVDYYIAYMLAIAILLFVGIYAVRIKNSLSNVNVYKSLFVYSILAVLLTAIIWLPALIQMMQSGRVGDGMIKSVSKTSMMSPYQTAVPMLFCIAFPIVVIIYDMIIRRSRRDDMHSIILLMFVLMIIPFLLEPINKMWHVGQYQCFPCRFGYMPMFLSLLYCTCGTESDNESKNNLTISIICVIVLCLIVIIFGRYVMNIRIKNTDDISRYAASLWGNERSFGLLLGVFLITLIAYFVPWIMYHNECLPKNVIIAFIAVLFVIESFNNVNIYMIYPAKKNADLNKNIVHAFNLADKIRDMNFYRVKSHAKVFNNNFIGSLGYNTIAHYTSLNNQTYMWTMKRLGYTGVWMETGSTDGTRLTDALLSIHYEINGGVSHSKQVFHSSAGYIHRLPEYLPMGLLLEKGRLDEYEEIPQNLTRIPIQHYISNAVFGEELITDYVPVNNVRKSGKNWILNNGESIKYVIQIKREQTIYVECFDKLTNHVREPIYDAMDVYVNGVKTAWSYPNSGWNGLDRLGDFADTTVEIEVRMKKSIRCSSFGIFGVDVQRLGELCASAQGVGLIEKGNGLVGSCDLVDAKSCFVSLPYQDNFSVKINGKKIKYRRCFSGFISFDLPQGHNDIRISFIPKGLIIGLLIFLIGVALLILYIKYGKKLDEYSLFTNIAKYTVIFVSVAVVLCVYVLPLIMNMIAK